MKFEYEGFPYSQEQPGGPCTIYVENAPRYTFATPEELTAFCDDANAKIKAQLQPFFLHLTGCKRCKRTYNGTMFSPCKTGVPLFMDGKRVALAFVDAAL